MTDEELIEQVARVIIGPREPVPEGSQYSIETLRVIRWDHAENSLRNDALWAARAILPIIEAARAQGWNEAIEAAAEAFEAEAETWLQLPARGSCSRLGSHAIRALTKENSDGDL